MANKGRKPTEASLFVRKKFSEGVVEYAELTKLLTDAGVVYKPASVRALLYSLNRETGNIKVGTKRGRQASPITLKIRELFDSGIHEKGDILSKLTDLNLKFNEGSVVAEVYKLRKAAGIKTEKIDKEGITPVKAPEHGTMPPDEELKQWKAYWEYLELLNDKKNKKLQEEARRERERFDKAGDMSWMPRGSLKMNVRHYNSDIPMPKIPKFLLRKTNEKSSARKR